MGKSAGGSRTNPHRANSVARCCFVQRFLSGQERTFVDCLKSKIEEVRADQPVTYIVDLSNLGPRLDPDRVQPFYYYRWHPDKEFPMVSEIGPDRILVKLIHK